MNKNTFFYKFFVGFFVAIWHFLQVIYYRWIRRLNGQELYNYKAGLPIDWQPTEYLGPARGADAWIRTPGGIKVRTWGFDRTDVPLVKKGDLSGVEKKARVILQDIDRIWAQVLTYYSKPGAHGYSPAQQKKAATLPPDYPFATIWPTIRWSDMHGCYVGGLCLNEREACVTVWYESVSDLAQPTVTNWEDYLIHEFGHVVNYAVGLGPAEPKAMASKMESL